MKSRVSVFHRPWRGRDRAVSGWWAVAALCLALAACSSGSPSSSGGASSSPAAVAAAGSAAPAPRRDPIEGGPFPALFVAQAQFVDQTGPDGKTSPVPGSAKLTILRKTPSGWQTSILEDPDSNVFHKAIAWPGGLLTIGATEARLKTWRLDGGKWVDDTHWAPKFGGKFDRLRDFEIADVDGDGKDDVVIATHDQGVVAIVHPAQNWRVDEIDRQANTFAHEIEIGDVDGDGKLEIFASVSQPNKLDEAQAGEVHMYRRALGGKWIRTVVDSQSDTHAKEILTADVDGDGKAELYVVWEGAIGKDGAVVRPVTVKQYRMSPEGKWSSSVVATVPDRQMRSIAAGDVNGDGKVDLVAGGLASGLWLFEQNPDGTWKSSLIDAKSTGFEQPVFLADLDGDGKLEIYVAAEDQNELRQYRWQNGKFESQVVAKLNKGDITWNITAGRL